MPLGSVAVDPDVVAVDPDVVAVDPSATVLVVTFAFDDPVASPDTVVVVLLPAGAAVADVSTAASPEHAAKPTTVTAAIEPNRIVGFMVGTPGLGGNSLRTPPQAAPS